MENNQPVLWSYKTSFNQRMKYLYFAIGGAVPSAALWAKGEVEMAINALILSISMALVIYVFDLSVTSVECTEYGIAFTTIFRVRSRRVDWGEVESIEKKRFGKYELTTRAGEKVNLDLLPQEAIDRLMALINERSGGDREYS